MNILVSNHIFEYIKLLSILFGICNLVSNYKYSLQIFDILVAILLANIFHISVADGQPDAKPESEPAGYSSMYGPYSGYYGMRMGRNYHSHSGPLSYANYGYKSYGYGGRTFRYKRSASSTPPGYSAYDGKYAIYY